MVKMNIAMDNDILQQLQMALVRFGAKSMPSTAATMRIGAHDIAERWRGFASGGSLKGVKPLVRPNRSYALGVKVQRLGPFEYEIFNESKTAQQIEEGTPELDMKTTHPYGQKSRVAQSGPNKGVPYLIVPFRWGTPGTKRNPRVGFRNVMPQVVYNIVKNKMKFRQTKTTVPADKSDFMTPNASGEMVGRAQYSDVTGKKAWGDTLSADMGGSVTNNMVGMSSMVGQNGRAAGYLTFRVISAASPLGSWIKPKVEPRHVVSALADDSRDMMNTLIEEAVREDLGL
jgi:hypothetical protein